MISEKRAKWSVLIFMLCWFGVLLWGFHALVNYRPRSDSVTPEAIEAEKEQVSMPGMISPQLQADEAGARKIKRKWATLKEQHDHLMAEYQKIPRFRPPRDNHLTAEQILAMSDIYWQGREAVKAFERNELGPRPGFFKALATYAYIPAYVEVLRRQGLVKHQMTDEELSWVARRTMEAGLFAVNRKWETRQGTPEERERIKQLRQDLAGNVGLSEGNPPEKGGTKYFPERLDASKIPRHNLVLFLDHSGEIIWSGINFFYLTFDREDILRAAQALPE